MSLQLDVSKADQNYTVKFQDRLTLIEQPSCAQKAFRNATPKDIKLDKHLKIKLGSEVDLRFKLADDTLLEFENCILNAWSDQTSHDVSVY